MHTLDWSKGHNIVIRFDQLGWGRSLKVSKTAKFIMVTTVFICVVLYTPTARIYTDLKCPYKEQDIGKTTSTKVDIGASNRHSMYRSR